MKQTVPVPRALYEATFPDNDPRGPEPPGSEPAAEILPFNTFDAGDWEGVLVEPRRWLVRNRIPAGEPGIMSGDGGTGKTGLMLQLAAAVAGELPDWINGVVETHGPVIVFSAEEKLKEMHRRVADILAHRGLSFSNVKGQLRFICDSDDVTLAKVERDGIVRPTLSLLRLEKTVALIRPALVAIENAADVYAGNENDRAPVSRFVRKLLGGLGQISNAAVGLIQHPSVSGLNDGTGRSGSTGWNNAGRWRQNFTQLKTGDDTDSGLRQFEVVKSNYGPRGEKVRLRWERGVFVPEGSASSAERAAAEAPVDEAFLRCLDAVTARGIRVSPNRSVSYAPTVFETMPEAGGAKKGGLEMAMQRHLAAGRVKVVQGPRKTDQLARTDA
jgi:RecA-family ATPase